MRLLVAVLALFALAGCGGNGPDRADRDPEERLRTSSGGNFVLYVSNQSFETETVDIRVVIDGRLAVEDDFAVEDQHNWAEFRFRLAPGSHVIHAESERGGAELTRRFTVAGKRWAVLNYWYYPGEARRFSFDISARPIGLA